MHDTYLNPLCSRYAGKKMQYLFSDDKKFSTWRKLWVALAEAEQELGLAITDSEIAEMKAHINDIDYDFANKMEHELRHDVMAHIHTFGQVCKEAKGIIHLGATSAYVGDNTDLIIQKEALELVRERLLGVIKSLSDFAAKYKNLKTLAYTHFQPAQPTTVGKRATLWLQDLMMDLEHLDFILNNLKFHGCRGTTGTGASFLELFNNDSEKVLALEKIIAQKMGFNACYDVSGQTYSRKVDYYTLSVLSSIAQSATKFSSDIRLLSHEREVSEPFEEKQVGSSAMAYKRNPMRSERMASLARLVLTLTLNPAITASAQWLERTLDDSANRRISIPEAFLAIDGILALYQNIIDGLTVYPAVIKKHYMAELPFMATENILMECVKKGLDRQTIHEEIRKLSVQTINDMKEKGKENDLLERIANDKVFNLTKNEIDKIIEACDFTGIASIQVDNYLKKVNEALEKNKAFLNNNKAEINV